MWCRNCGTELNYTEGFCYNCGTKIEPIPAQQSPQAKPSTSTPNFTPSAPSTPVPPTPATPSSQPGPSVYSQDVKNLFSQGSKALKDKQYHEAARCYQLAADMGHAGAQNNLGYFYEKGLGVEKDVKKAFHFYSLSANQGDKTAQRNMGNCYYIGLGVTADFDQAVYWMQKAANQDDAPACRRLGEFYSKYPHINAENAVYWYEKAAALNDVSSLLYMGRHFNEGNPNYDAVKSTFYLEKAASLGTPENIFSVAEEFKKNVWNHGPLSLEKAKQYFIKAGDAGDNALKLKVAESLDYPEHSIENNSQALDVETAFSIYRTLAAEGMQEAMIPCGNCYETGHGTPGHTANLNLAAAWYERAGSDYGRRRAAWCRHQLTGGKTPLEERLEHSIAPVVDTHSHKKEYYSHVADFDKFEYRDKMYYLNHDTVCRSNMDGSEIEVLAQDEDYEWCYLTVNDAGIFIYRYNYCEDTPFYLMWLNLDGTKKKQLQIEGSIRDIYVYDDYVYYIRVVDDGPGGEEQEELHLLRAATEETTGICVRAFSIGRVCGNKKLVVFHASFRDDNQDFYCEDSGWMMYHLDTMELVSMDHKRGMPINVLFHPEAYDEDSPSYIDETITQEIEFVDLARNIMWIRQVDCDWNAPNSKQGAVSVKYLEAHALSHKPNKILPDTPIWKLDYSTHNLYFDGRVCYDAQSYYQFYSYDRLGNKSQWNHSGHGNCNKFSVFGNYLFLDKEAYEEEQYHLTDVESEPIRTSWFAKPLE